MIEVRRQKINNIYDVILKKSGAFDILAQSAFVVVSIDRTVPKPQSENTLWDPIQQRHYRSWSLYPSGTPRPDFYGDWSPSNPWTAAPALERANEYFDELVTLLTDKNEDGWFSYV